MSKNKESTRVCFYCDQDILPEDSIFMLGIDVPYVNLFFHKDHYALIKDRISVFLTENIEKVYNYRDK